MLRPYRIEGYAIVSADGMIADAAGVMPKALKIEADQRYFAQALDGVAAVVHGRHSHEQQPASPCRPRLILTRRVARVAPDPENARALLWNPAALPFAEACRALGIAAGRIAVIGGTDAYGLFLAIGYDAFHLSRADRVRLPGGRPLFPDGPDATPDDVLRRHGLVPCHTRLLDAAADVTLTVWERE